MKPAVAYELVEYARETSPKQRGEAASLYYYDESVARLEGHLTGDAPFTDEREITVAGSADQIQTRIQEIQAEKQSLTDGQHPNNFQRALNEDSIIAVSHRKGMDSAGVADGAGGTGKNFDPRSARQAAQITQDELSVVRKLQFNNPAEAVMTLADDLIRINNRIRT